MKCKRETHGSSVYTIIHKYTYLYAQMYLSCKRCLVLALVLKSCILDGNNNWAWERLMLENALSGESGSMYIGMLVCVYNFINFPHKLIHAFVHIYTHTHIRKGYICIYMYRLYTPPWFVAGHPHKHCFKKLSDLNCKMTFL